MQNYGKKVVFFTLALSFANIGNRKQSENKVIFVKIENEAKNIFAHNSEPLHFCNKLAVMLYYLF